MVFETWGATVAEIERTLPGDELILEPGMSATRAISLSAGRDEVFAWLAQMGWERAGWYSYDWIDNRGRPSATEINPEWAVTAIGDRVPGGPVDFVVADIQQPEHLVLALLCQRLAGHAIEFTLAFRLRPLDLPRGSGDGSTRLVSRARARIAGPLSRPATTALAVGDGVMARRQLLGLADRCTPST